MTLAKEAILPATSNVRATLETTWGGRKIGYIVLPRFADSSPRQMREAIASFENADGLVLDLRNNPGGGIVALQEIAGMFLGRAAIGSLEGRFETTELFSTGTRLTDKPLVAIVNEGTASAAELLAGALQASKRAALVGAPTFGKGLVHGFFPLKDGAAIAVTVGQLQTPRGDRILNWGIVPEVRVEMKNSPLLDPAVSPSDRKTDYANRNCFSGWRELEDKIDELFALQLSHLFPLDRCRRF